MNKYNHEHDCPFEAYITNLGKYNEGELVGEWVKLPADQETLDAVFKRIGIGSTDEFGQPYEEWFISDYDCYVENLYELLGEYESLDNLNRLAEDLEDMNDEEYQKFCAVLELESIPDLDYVIEIAENLDRWTLYAGVDDDYSLGYYYIHDACMVDIDSMGELKDYIDYERYGRDIAIRTGGLYADQGYIF